MCPPKRLFEHRQLWKLKSRNILNTGERDAFGTWGRDSWTSAADLACGSPATPSGHQGVRRMLESSFYSLTVRASRVMNGIYMNVVFSAFQEKQFSVPDVRSLNSGVAPGHLEKPRDFNPAPMALKVIISVPEEARKHAKWYLISPAFNICENAVFATHYLWKPGIKSPRHPDFYTTVGIKSGLETSLEQKQSFSARWSKSFQNGVPKWFQNR